ncbi:MAG: DUF58 domain-containing protein [Planctomycetes bacterium]|nr:DUF58 domain-containing protein [Planctomycetota bacterium]
MADPAHPLLDLTRMEVLRRVRLRPSGSAEGHFSGPHKSHYRGAAVEFADYREYVDGDDIRLVDWKVFARSDRYVVRLYEAERNLFTYLLLDASASMGFAGAAAPSESKLVFGSRLAAALAYLAVREGDEVGLTLAGDRLRDFHSPRASWPHLRVLLDALGEARAAGGTDLGCCLGELFARASRRGVLVVLSDFLEHGPDFWKAIDLFRVSRFDVLFFHVVHPEELDLPRLPSARFLDSEGDGQFLAEPEVVRELYRERFARFLVEVEAAARARGCDWYLARTDADPYAFLQRCFLAREAVR